MNVEGMVEMDHARAIITDEGGRISGGKAAGGCVVRPRILV